MKSYWERRREEEQKIKLKKLKGGEKEIKWKKNYQKILC